MSRTVYLSPPFAALDQGSSHHLHDYLLLLTSLSRRHLKAHPVNSLLATKKVGPNGRGPVTKAVHQNGFRKKID